MYIVTMVHPDGPDWNQYVAPHVEYLLELIDQGKLVASGPLKGTSLRSGFLIFKASCRSEVEELVSKDPFAIEGLICELSIEEWDPLFGAFSEYSSKSLPPELDQIRKRHGL